MKLIRTEEARPGMQVAKDVTDLRGNVLFKAGTPLDVPLIERCRQRNVSHLFIEEISDGAAASETDTQVRREHVLRQIDRMFAGTESSAVMVSLREAAKRYVQSLGG